MKKILLSVACVAMAGLSFGQFYQIPNPNSGGNPGGLNTDPEFPPGGGGATGWATVAAGPQTGWTAAQTIPFSFSFDGGMVSSYRVHPSGLVSFSTATTLPNPGARAALPTTNIPDSTICFWGISIGTGDNILSKTFGTAPNRQHWIQFNSAVSAGTISGWVYGSIVLEESTGKIHVVDQRIQCVQGTSGCAGRPDLTVGVQATSTKFAQHADSPNFNGTAGNNPAPDDNGYTTFIPGTQPANNIQVTGLDMAEYLVLGNAPFTIKGDLRNLGSAALTGYGVSYSVNGGAAVNAAVTGQNVASLANGTFSSSSTWTPSAAGNYSIKAWTSLPNGSADGDTSDDTATFDVIVVDTFIQRKPLYEIFTSSTCGPCRPGNVNFHGVTDPDIGNFVSIKWQQNFPGTGDPYVTQEALDRRAYYSINSIPRMEIDGGWDANAASFTAQLHTDQKAVPAFAAIKPRFVRVGKKIIVDVEVTAVSDIQGANRLMVAVVEKLTTKNVKTNGETEFEHVMKKMIPNLNGTSLGNLTKNQVVNRSFEYTFNGDYRLPADGQAGSMISHSIEHSVEEFEDLVVAVWIESGSGVGSTIVQAEEVEDFCKSLNVVVTTTDGVTSTEAPCNGEATVTVTGATNPTFRWGDPGAQTTATATGLCEGDVDVTVIDESGCEFTKTVKIGSTVGILENNLESMISVYPNPAKDNFTVTISELSENVEISIVDISGKTIETHTGNVGENNISLENVAAGVYTVNIATESASVTRRLIVE